jgi:hypothetical protein
VASLLSVLAIVLVGRLAGMVVLWARAEDNATNARLSEATAKRLALTEAAARAEAQAKIAGDARKSYGGIYIHGFNLAQREWLANNVALAEDLRERCPTALRDWEWSC